jgi:hypothetical protein
VTTPTDPCTALNVTLADDARAALERSARMQGLEWGDALAVLLATHWQIWAAKNNRGEVGAAIRVIDSWATLVDGTVLYIESDIRADVPDASLVPTVMRIAPARAVRPPAFPKPVQGSRSMLPPVAAGQCTCADACLRSGRATFAK